MKVAEIMHSGVASVHQDLSLREVGQALIGWRISGAPVVDDAGAPVGVVSLADLAARAAGLDRPRERRYLTDLAEPPQEEAPDWGSLSSADTARSVMTSFLVRVEEDTPVYELVDLIIATGIHRVFVTRQGKLTGVVSTMDLVKLLGRVLQVAV